MIELRSLSKRFRGELALDGLNLQANTGRIALLVCLRGDGPSAALKIAAGLLREDNGSVAFDRQPASQRQRRQLSAYLPRRIGFHPLLNARQILAFYARAYNASSQRIYGALAFWGLDASHSRLPTYKLSGMLRQRLGLAATSLSDSRMLLLDEPTLNLDDEWRDHMLAWLRQQANAGKTVLVASGQTGEWNKRADIAFSFEYGRADKRLDPRRLRRPMPPSKASEAATAQSRE